MLRTASSPIPLRNRNSRAIQSNRKYLHQIFRLPTLSWRKKAQMKLQHNCEEKGYKNLCCLEKQSFRIVEFLRSFSLRMCTQTVPLKGRNFEIKINQLPCFRPLTRVSGSYNTCSSVVLFRPKQKIHQSV